MKSADIIPGRDYLVRLPKSAPCLYIADRILPVRARAGELTEGRKRAFHVYAIERPQRPGRASSNNIPPRTFMLSAANVVQTWAEYTLARVHAEALTMNDMRDYRIARAAEDARRAPFIDALRGITVEAEAFSHANFDRPPVDLGAEVERIFCGGRSYSASVSFAVFEAVAAELVRLRRAILEAGGTWEGRVDDGVATVHVLPPKPPRDVDAVLARLDAALGS